MNYEENREYSFIFDDTEDTCNSEIINIGCIPS
jgi:hypothetical protein